MDKKSFSLAGWNFYEWLKGNWKTLKEVFKVGMPLFASLNLFPDNPVAQYGLAAVGKMLCDVLEYWIKHKKDI